MPARRKSFPTLIEIALKLLGRAQKLLKKAEKLTGKNIKVVAIVFDAASISKKLYKQAKHLFPGTQIISQIESNQLVADKSGEFKTVADYFQKDKFQKQKIAIRDQEEQVYYAAARVTVKAMGAKLLVVALRYEGQNSPRYLVVSELSLRAQDVITAYSSRWIVEVLFEDLKQFCGLNRRACLQRKSGSCGTVVMSMIADIYAHSCPEQLKRLSSVVPVLTTGSIARIVRTNAVIGTLEQIVSSKAPERDSERICSSLRQIQDLRTSQSSLSNESFFELGPSESLKRKFVV